ncbi:RNA polymerase sigma factor [Gilvimarinus sp. DA14]|uniref:RNA polymerase sigma factor n=1 Tax=Gilvimarinus sp. DA14 TaxID=2956798 RepID=UPI0020B8B634|nr:sigma-70 family RNA polymerase sigma factor [Gilvimarinus sp. DA14]UTF61150.1 sigma-70 family RNA polymerase sigma factor [Gilvimarinus sp. DA14]
MSQTTTANHSESELIDAALAGDHSAYAKLIDTHYSVMLAVAGAIAGESLAEDIVQDAWISAHRALARFEKRSSLKTWLLRIVSNEARTRVKSEGRSCSLDNMALRAMPSDDHFKSNGHWASATSQWHLDTPEKMLEQEQLQRCINKTLTLLPPAQKAVFILRDLQDAPFDEIGAVLEISQSNARVLIHRARLTLMAVITRYQETGQC